MRITISKLRKKLHSVADEAERQIELQTRGSGLFGTGLGREGYLGGYVQAIQDVMAAIDHGYPSDPRRLWKGDVP